MLINGCNRTDLDAPIIDPNRIIEVEVDCHTFNNTTKKIKVKVLDVTANSVKKIFDELFENRFPIYAAIGYENRKITNGSMASLHAFGAAIDVNEHMNPYYDAPKGRSSINPKRLLDKRKDKKELELYLEYRGVINKEEKKATLDAIIQESDSDDWFINRNIIRKGMITEDEAKIFIKHGFTIWGGRWKQPMDFMHFQLPRKLTEYLSTISKDEGDIVWKNHILITRLNSLLKEKLASSALDLAKDI